MAFLCRQNHSGGLLHVGLPDSTRLKKVRIHNVPGMFADTGIPLALEGMKSAGWNGKDSMTVKIAGGAEIPMGTQTFNIGRRVVAGVVQALARSGLAPDAADTGGSFNRTVRVVIASGEVVI